ncbi:MAG: hypothetical protein CMJ77_19710 [Planctomycetaceae bacterium]|nr:hypothetical protein [Planctomycetaceae bacterium]
MRILGLLSLLLAVTVVSAEESTPTQSASPEATSLDVDQLIEQLNANRFSLRQQATEKLIVAGPDVIPKLVKAAQNGPAEITARVVEILEQHLKSEQKGTSDEAKAALKQIAESANPAVARFAKKALGLEVPEESEAEPAPKPVAPPIGNAPFRIQNGQIQMQFQFNGNGGRKVTQTNVNGVKNTTAEEDGKKVTIKEEVNGSIKLSLTEEDEDGKPKQTKYEADSLQELKEKHPKAHRLYKKYTGKNIAVPIQIPGLQPFRPKAAADAQRLKLILEQLKTINLENVDDETRAALQKQLDQIKEQLKPSS